MGKRGRTVALKSTLSDNISYTGRYEITFNKMFAVIYFKSCNWPGRNFMAIIRPLF
jgi:hypothetical protein